MHKIKATLFIAGILFASSVWAQTELKIQGASPALYLSHNVVAKETWYSIGRLYNVTPAEIAKFNSTTIQKSLSVGQALKIPLVNGNFSQDGVRAADEVFVPVYYTVQDKEWMYRISQKHNKVAIANLEKWNTVTNDHLKAGMNLVVGYLKVKSGQSALAARGSKKIVAVTAAPVVAKNEPVTETKKPEQKETVVTTPPVTNPASSEIKEPATQTQTAQTTTKPVQQLPSPNSNVETSNYGFKGGYFRSGFNENGKNATGNAGVFRSTSGWKDGKYYALMNNVPVGTIIKVTFPSTSKSVYAKVLGQLPEMRESNGLAIRISDAAAAELGAELGKFYVDVKY